MTSTAIFIAILGIVAQFIPQEILIQFGPLPNELAVLTVQLMGALYIGFAMVNWMLKEKIIGGIYNRPIALGNFAHFTIGAISLIRVLASDIESVILIILLIFYVLFAAVFTYKIFTHPIKS